jgi:hypothetical protein
MNKFLGRLPKKQSGTPSFRSLLIDSSNLNPPVSTNNRAAVSDWNVLANDKCGCCVVAAMMHGNQAISANANIEIVPDPNSCVDQYTKIGIATSGQGYDPATGANDNGLNISDAAKYWMKEGIWYTPIVSGKVIGQAIINVADEILLKYAIDQFCGVLAGVDLPTTAEGEFDQKVPWALTVGQAGGWGGHGIWIIDYDPTYLYCVTWGKIQAMTWEWLRCYCDELVVILDPQWISKKTQTSPLNVTLTTLEKEIIAMNGTAIY